MLFISLNYWLMLMLNMKIMMMIMTLSLFFYKTKFSINMQKLLLKKKWKNFK